MPRQKDLCFMVHQFSMRQVGIVSVVKKWLMYEKDITENEINKFKFKYLREQKNK